jgi:hypothetical protein
MNRNTWALLPPDLRLAADVIDFIKGRYSLLEDDEAVNQNQDAERLMCQHLVLAVTAEVLDILRERQNEMQPTPNDSH